MGEELSVNGLSLVGDIDGPMPNLPAGDARRRAQDSGRWLSGFEVALSQAENGKWYVSTLELQLASFRLCGVCRSVRTLRVRVSKYMPRCMWGDDVSADDTRRVPAWRQLPLLRAAGVIWIVPVDMLMPQLSESDLLKGVESMEVVAITRYNWKTSPHRTIEEPVTISLPPPSPSRCFDEMISSIDLPYVQYVGMADWNRALHARSSSSVVHWASLTSARSDRLKNMLHLLSWPASLRRLTLGGVGQPIPRGQYPFRDLIYHLVESIVWPASLLELTFGYTFNEPITGIVWPVSLLKLTFGFSFNQCVEGITWPVVLEHLVLGNCFNHPIAGATWPVSLRRLEFGAEFSHAIDATTLPGSLQQLKLGCSLNHLIGSGSLPASLRELTFGIYVDQSIDGNGMLPAGLQQLHLGYVFNHPIDSVMWPASLLTLTFWGSFNQPIHGVRWPARLRQLSFGERFNQPVSNVVWPRHLRVLDLDGDFNQPIIGVELPPLLEVLRFGDAFKQQVKGVVWPTSLKVLEFDSDFYQTLEGIEWPVTLLVEKGTYSGRICRRLY